MHYSHDSLHGQLSFVSKCAVSIFVNSFHVQTLGERGKAWFRVVDFSCYAFVYASSAVGTVGKPEPFSLEKGSCSAGVHVMV